MQLFPVEEPVTLYETDFTEDKLERQKLSEQLSDLVERIDNPIVIALDDKWGTGKSYFLKRWVGAHTKQNKGKALTVYFDAFEHDYLSEPLRSIVTALSARLPESQNTRKKNWKKQAIRIAKPLAEVGLSIATLGAKEQVGEFGDAVIDALSGQSQEIIEKFWEESEETRERAMGEFRQSLIEATEELQSKIVIVIDELDRCRPDYALSLLETIKHFFAVPNVHFILGVNGAALQESVKIRYGSNIDAERYLGKFINLSFSLPNQIGRQQELNTLLQYLEYQKQVMGLPKRTTDRVIDLIKISSSTHEISLRDAGKILSRIALLPQEVSTRDETYLEGYISIAALLIVTSIISPPLHKMIINGECDVDHILKLLDANIKNISKAPNGEVNHDFSSEKTLWFCEISYCLFPNKLEENQFVPEYYKGIGSRFGQYGGLDNPTIFAKSLQREWIDLFRT